MKYIPTVITLSLIFVSCRSVRTYEMKKLTRLIKSYRAQPLLQGFKGHSTRKEADEFIGLIEERLALAPDSLIIIMDTDQATQTDSFYFNPLKTGYIKRHGLITPGKKFIPRTQSK